MIHDASSSRRRLHGRWKHSFRFALMDWRLEPTGFLPFLRWIFCLGILLPPLAAKDESHRRFALPAAAAEATLEAFSEQADVQIVYLVEDVRGVVTNAVQGEFAVRETLEHMVAGTALRVQRDEKTGAFVIKRDRQSPPLAEKPITNQTKPPPNTMKKRTTFVALLLTIFGWADTANLPAQTSVPSESPDASQSESSATAEKNTGEVIVKLNPFQVTAEQDHGYRVTNSLTATGMNTAIADAPLSIAVMPIEFIQDKGGFRLKDFMNTLPGVNAIALEQDAGNVVVRGLQTVTQRDGFGAFGGNTAASLSSVGVDRVEVIKGPSSVFNGIITPGGVVNVVYKTPSFTPSAYLEATTGSFQFGSVDLFATGPLVGKKLAYLLEGYLKDNNAWRDWQGNNDKTQIYGLTFKPVDAVNLTLSYRNTDLHDQFGAHLARVHTGYQSAGLPWDTDAVAWSAKTFGPNEPPFNLIVADKDYPGGFRYNVNGPQNFRKVHETFFHPELTIHINDHFDFRNGFLRNQVESASLWGQQPPNAGSPTSNGSSYSVRPTYTYLRASNVFNKTQLVVHFDTGPLNHSLLIGYDYSTSDSSSLALRVAKGHNWNAFQDGPIMVFDEFIAAFPNYQSTPLVGPVKVSVTGPYFAEQISGWDGRVHLLLGARKTTQETTNAGATSSIKASKTTPQMGLLVRPFSNGALLKHLSLFVNYSRSFEPSGLVDAAGQVVPPANGTGKEAGFKFYSPDNTISATISYFIEDRYDIAQGDPVRGAGYYNLGGVQGVKGGEIDTIWTPSSHFQVSANYTYLPTAKTIALASNPNEVGVRFPIVPVHRGNINAKYTFTSGRLKNFYFGGGMVAQTKIRANANGTWIFNIWAPAAVEFDAFCGYSMPIFGREVKMSLNVQNVFNRRGYSWDVATPNEPIRGYFAIHIPLINK